jgi:hypothetical protein
MKGIIYKLIQIDNNKTIYIGKSQLSAKDTLQKLKYNSTRYLNWPLFVYINANGELDSFKIEIIEEAEYKDDKELVSIKNNYINEYTKTNTLLNKRLSEEKRNEKDKEKLERKQKKIEIAQKKFEEDKGEADREYHRKYYYKINDPVLCPTCLRSYVGFNKKRHERSRFHLNGGKKDKKDKKDVVV